MRKDIKIKLGVFTILTAGFVYSVLNLPRIEVKDYALKNPTGDYATMNKEETKEKKDSSKDASKPADIKTEDTKVGEVKELNITLKEFNKVKDINENTAKYLDCKLSLEGYIFKSNVSGGNYVCSIGDSKNPNILISVHGEFLKNAKDKLKIKASGKIVGCLNKDTNKYTTLFVVDNFKVIK